MSLKQSTHTMERKDREDFAILKQQTTVYEAFREAWRHIFATMITLTKQNNNLENPW